MLVHCVISRPKSVLTSTMTFYSTSVLETDVVLMLLNVFFNVFNKFELCIKNAVKINLPTSKESGFINLIN